MSLAEGDHVFEKAEDILIRTEPSPVEPDRRVIDIVWVGVALLGVHELVARTEHRRAIGEHQQGAEIPDLLLAQRGDRGRRFAVARTDAIPAMLAVVVVGYQIVHT